MKKYFVYVIKNRYSKLYKGITFDLKKRLAEHNSNKNISTKYKGPWHIVYSEELNNRSEARNREKFLKSGLGREWLKKKLNNMGA